MAWLSTRAPAAHDCYYGDSDDDNLLDGNSEQWADDRMADDFGDGLLESDGFLETIDVVFQSAGRGF